MLLVGEGSGEGRSRVWGSEYVIWFNTGRQPNKAGRVEEGVTFVFNQSYLTHGDLEKIRPKRPTKFGRNDPGPRRPRQKRHRVKMTGFLLYPQPPPEVGIK